MASYRGDRRADSGAPAPVKGRFGTRRRRGVQAGRAAGPQSAPAAVPFAWARTQRPPGPAPAPAPPRAPNRALRRAGVALALGVFLGAFLFALGFGRAAVFVAGAGAVAAVLSFAAAGLSHLELRPHLRRVAGAARTVAAALRRQGGAALTSVVRSGRLAAAYLVRAAGTGGALARRGASRGVVGARAGATVVASALRRAAADAAVDGRRLGGWTGARVRSARARARAAKQSALPHLTAAVEGTRGHARALHGRLDVSPVTRPVRTLAGGARTRAATARTAGAARAAAALTHVRIAAAAAPLRPAPAAGWRLASESTELRRSGRPREAAAAAGRAAKAFRRAEDPRGEALALNSLALAHADAGRFDEAVEALDAALALLTRTGASHDAGMVLANLGTIHHRAGGREAARFCWTKALERLDESSRESQQTAALLARS